MQVEVRPYAGFKSRLGGDRNVELAEGATAGDLLKALPRAGEVLFEGSGLKDDVNILVNGQNIDNLDGLQTRLDDRDVVVIFAAAIGG
ncbi:MAG TPA: MoaD/ThiS family protein [Methanotrichaceae archaeon]|nr:MoaD/ThiS family protein [Methanotrichaceae archaeon]